MRVRQWTASGRLVCVSGAVPHSADSGVLRVHRRERLVVQRGRQTRVHRPDPGVPLASLPARWSVSTPQQESRRAPTKGDVCDAVPTRWGSARRAVRRSVERRASIRRVLGHGGVRAEGASSRLRAWRCLVSHRRPDASRRAGVSSTLSTALATRSAGRVRTSPPPRFRRRFAPFLASRALWSMV